MRFLRTSVLIFASLLASYSSEDRFSVDGVESQFCVPKKGYIAPDVWFLPEDAPGTPRGFSFSGCHSLALQDQAECTFPKEFVSADVVPLSEKRNVVWKDLKNAAVFTAIAGDTTANYSIDPSTKMLVISSKRVWDEWFVWKRSDSDQSDTELNDRDRLLVSCANVGSSVWFNGSGKPGEYGCRRYSRGGSYALDYKFISKVPIPTEIQLMQLESKLFGGVDKWRCPK